MDIDIDKEKYDRLVAETEAEWQRLLDSGLDNLIRSWNPEAE